MFGTRRTAAAYGLIAAAVFGVTIVRFSIVFAAYYAIVASLGICIGFGARRGWTYGKIVTVCTVLAFSLALGAALATWEDWSQEGQRIYEQWTAMIAASADNGSDTMADTREQLAWLLRDHWTDIGLGMTFASTLIMVCLAVSGSAKRLRGRYNTAGPVGSFRDMRTPEWLVWVGIVAALLWFLDNQRPDMGLRPYVWNTAAGLAAVYWLNGVSIAFFAAALSGTPMAYTVAFVAAVLCGAYVVFFLGLFDTWVDFRRRLHRWHETLIRLQGPDA